MRNNTALAPPMLLQSVPQIKRVPVVKRLKNIQPPPQNNLPPRIRLDLAIVNGAGFVVGPVKVDAGAGGVGLDALQEFGLLVAAFFVLIGLRREYGYSIVAISFQAGRTAMT